MSKSDETFGGRLRALRQAAALSQEDLARRAGLTVDAIGSLERGVRRRPHPHTVRVIAEALALDDAQRAELMAAVPRRAGSEPPPDRQEPDPPASGVGWQLPNPVTPLLGRDGELERVSRLLEAGDVRLVTLTGPGGVGKTRLAIAAARAAKFPDGEAFVALASVATPDGVIPAIAAALGLRDLPGHDAVGSLAAQLRGSALLVVLDDAEHVLDAAPVVATLLESCQGLVLLATSRAPLRVRGEVEHPVAPLSVTDATRLFRERAQAAAPATDLGGGAEATIIEIVRRLAGLPLAVELAAAKTRTFDPQTLLRRLDEALMAEAGPRDLPARQRSIAATIDWSINLLSAREQRGLRLLSVFAGPFGLDDAEHVIGDSSAPAVLDSLVEQSLVAVRPEADPSSRFELLAPIQQRASHQLSDQERGEVCTRHALLMLKHAEAWEPDFRRADQGVALSRLSACVGDIRAAMNWSLSSGGYDVAARMAWALWLGWWLQGTWREGRQWAERSLAGDLATDTRTRALLVAASLAYAEGDVDSAGRRWAEAVESAAPHDVQGLASGIAGAGLVDLARGEVAAAGQQFTRAAALTEDVDDWLWSLTRVWLGTVRLLEGMPEDAAALAEQGLSSARARGDRLAAYVALFTLAQSATATGDDDLAEDRLREGVRLSGGTGDRANLAHFLDALAAIEGRRGSGKLAVTLLATAERMRSDLAGPSYLYYVVTDEERERSWASARDRLSPADFTSAVARGKALTFAEAVQLGYVGLPQR